VALGFEGQQKWFGRLSLLGDFFISRQHSPALPDVDIADLTVADFGLGWRAQAGGFQVGLTGKAGYANMSTRRTFQYWNADGTKGSSAELRGSANGALFSGVVNASYRANLGAGLYVQPRVAASVYDLRQNGYSESGDTILALKVDDRDSRAAKAKGEIEFGAQFGDEIKFKPKLVVGYEDLFSSELGLTTASFAGENPFSLGNQAMTGGYGLARVGFAIEGANVGFDLEGGGASGSRGSNYDGMITLRARF